jgi:PAS domain S-box-containing protein
MKHSLDAVFLTLLDGSILYANPAACSMCGFTLEELMALGRNAVVDPLEPRLPEAIEERRRTGRFQGVLTMVRKDGSRFPAEISSAVFIDANGEERTATFVRDISVRQQIEAERNKLIQDLQKALSEIKALRGILPICSSCKNIRDEKGSWKKIEAYIQDHSEAEFSHSICPDCAKRLYGNLPAVKDLFTKK